MNKIFGREPATLLALISSAVMLVTMFTAPQISKEQSVAIQGAVNAAAALAVGIITSNMVAKDGGLALIVGLLKSLLALGIAFGLKWTPDQQAIIMTFVTSAAQFFVRTQVTAKVPA